MDKATAENVRIGTTLYHVSLHNRDGSALRARVNGKCKTWKRDPNRFQLPMKHGLRECFYITEDNCHEWIEYDNTDPSERARYYARVLMGFYTEELKLDPTTPWQVVHDMLLEREQVTDAETLKHYVLNAQGY